MEQENKHRKEKKLIEIEL